jgi:aminoglycoside phosphotransferase (APT) family kinase protein
MIEADQKLARVVEKVAPHAKLLRSWALAGGISAGMTALEIERPDGQTQKLILRQPGAGALQANPRAAEDEFRVLQFAYSQGLPVPFPLALDSSGSIFSTPYLVATYIEGKMDFTPADPEDYARQMAAHLAQIHSIDGAGVDLSFLSPQPDELSGIIGLPPIKSDLTFYEEHIRAALESAWPKLKHNPPALLHGDFWPGNILWQGERLAGVIDWEDAHTGDPLSDLAISRLDLLWILGPHAMQAFTLHYRSMRSLDTANLPFWDLCAALRLVRLAGADLAAWAAYFHPYGRRDITPGSIREHYTVFIRQALADLA